MATGWVKSLHCKSRAFEDVYHHPNPKSLLSTSASCRKGAQTVRDVVEMARGNPKPRTQQPPPTKSKHSKPSKRDSDPNEPRARKVVPAATVSPHSSGSLCPPLTELPEGHPSRNVVEIIFHTSWSEKSAFPGRVEKIFKVQTGPKTTAQFEEYREAVKSRAGSGSGFGQGVVGGWCSEDNVARCVADGNEVMRFRCMGTASAGGGISSADFSAFSGGKVAAVCTFFAGSGSAHERAGGGKGRRAMLVCRVIAGRVAKQAGPDPFLEVRGGYDSVNGYKGELIVFDPRAVLPCFLIIYRL